MTSGRTWSDPLTTRDTVDLDTPASAAAASSVGATRRPGVSSVMMASLTRPKSERAASDYAAVSDCTLFRRALLGVVVDAHDPEALVVSPCPLEVVHERPVEVAVHGHALVD